MARRPVKGTGKGTDEATRKAKARAATKEEPVEEVSAKRAFLLSFVLFSIFLAPVLGLGFYFARNASFLVDLFPNKELLFIGGMGVGVLAAFVISIVFTRKAVA
jgi:hypothetical protein